MADGGVVTGKGSFGGGRASTNSPEAEPSEEGTGRWWRQARVPVGCGSGGRRDLKALAVLWSGGGVGETFPISLGVGMGISFGPGLRCRHAFLCPRSLEAAGHLAAVCVSAHSLKRWSLWGECVHVHVCACMCLQTGAALGLLWGWVSCWVPACGQPWEELSLQVRPWVWDIQYFNCVSAVVVGESLRRVFGLLLWGYLYKVVGYIFRNCVY